MICQFLFIIESKKADITHLLKIILIAFWVYIIQYSSVNFKIKILKLKMKQYMIRNEGKLKKEVGIQNFETKIWTIEGRVEQSNVEQ